MEKTNIMIFNKSGRLLNESYNFKFQGTPIKPVKSYCYLGINFKLSGSLTESVNTLTEKAVRSICQLKRSIVKGALSLKSLLNLFDSLIKPIATYTSQIWIYDTKLLKELIKFANGSKCDIMKSVNLDKMEIMHLRFIKWGLGIHKRASITATYGDTGRYPLVLTLIKQGFAYYKRIETLSLENRDNLVGKAFIEQQRDNLPWYSAWNTLQKGLPTTTPINPASLQSYYQDVFVNEWRSTINNQSKLKFYSSLKTTFGLEKYTMLPLASRKSIACLRSSAHDLNIERGRYLTKSKTPSIVDKLCL